MAECRVGGETSGLRMLYDSVLKIERRGDMVVCIVVVYMYKDNVKGEGCEHLSLFRLLSMDEFVFGLDSQSTAGGCQ